MTSQALRAYQALQKDGADPESLEWRARLDVPVRRYGHRVLLAEDGSALVTKEGRPWAVLRTTSPSDDEWHDHHVRRGEALHGWVTACGKTAGIRSFATALKRAGFPGEAVSPPQAAVPGA